MDKRCILIRHFVGMLQKGFTPWQHLLLFTALKTAASQINHSPVLKQGNNWFPCPTLWQRWVTFPSLLPLLPQDQGQPSLVGSVCWAPPKCLNLAMDLCQRNVLLCLVFSSKSILALVSNGATILLSQLQLLSPCPNTEDSQKLFQPCAVLAYFVLYRPVLYHMMVLMYMVMFMGLEMNPLLCLFFINFFFLF